MREVPDEVILVEASGDPEGPEEQYQREIAMTYDAENHLVQFDQYGEETFGTLEPIEQKEWEAILVRLGRIEPEGEERAAAGTGFESPALDAAVRADLSTIDLSGLYEPEYPGEPSVAAMKAAISTSQTWPMRGPEDRLKYVDRVRRLLQAAEPVIRREALLQHQSSLPTEEYTPPKIEGDGALAHLGDRVFPWIADDHYSFTGQELATLFNELAGAVSGVFLREDPQKVMPSDEVGATVVAWAVETTSAWARAHDKGQS